MEHKNLFSLLKFDDFKEMANNNTLSLIEKVGFPHHYRDGKEEDIFADILSKTNNLTKNNLTVLDIGCGCSHLTYLLIDLCEQNNHRLILIDSAEMLAQLPDKDFIIKVSGFYPNEMKWTRPIYQTASIFCAIIKCT
jgi:hypothetical protein